MSIQEKEEDASSTVNNDNVSVVITKKPHCQVKFDVKVHPPAVVAAYQKALKSVNKEVSIPGFRKGKAPDHIILEKFQSSIQKEFVDLVLQTGFNEALHLSHLHPLKDGKMTRPVVHECSKEKGAHFTIEFETRPLIPTVNIDELKIEKVIPAAITDQDRHNAMQNLLLQFANYEPISDRPVEENDFVDLNVTIMEDPPREVIHNQRTQVNPLGLPSWLREEVVGLKVGESAEGMTEQDPLLSPQNPDFQSLPFQVTVNAIWNGNLPLVDDELAKKVGLQSVDELREKIDQRLEQEAQEEAAKREMQTIENQLVESYPIDLPQSYIDANKQARLDDYLHQLHKQNREYTESDYLQIEKAVEESAIFQLNLFLLLRKIAAEHKISVTNEDISSELTRQVALMSSGRGSHLPRDKEKLHEQLFNLAMDRKIKEFLIEKATSA